LRSLIEILRGSPGYTNPPETTVPEAGDAGLEGPRFLELARSMGELLVIFCRLPTAGLELDDLWADPG
jgi:hypothetical protein